MFMRSEAYWSGSRRHLSGNRRQTSPFGFFRGNSWDSDPYLLHDVYLSEHQSVLKSPSSVTYSLSIIWRTNPGNHNGIYKVQFSSVA